MAGNGRLRGTPPKREPIVSIGRWNHQVSSAATPTAASRPGKRGAIRLRPKIIPRHSADMPMAVGLKVGKAPQSAASFGTSGPGSLASERPRRSRISPAKMMSAMPAVKPTVTGWGMYLI